MYISVFPDDVTPLKRTILFDLNFKLISSNAFCCNSLKTIFLGFEFPSMIFLFTSFSKISNIPFSSILFRTDAYEDFNCLNSEILTSSFEFIFNCL